MQVLRDNVRVDTLPVDQRNQLQSRPDAEYIDNIGLNVADVFSPLEEDPQVILEKLRLGFFRPEITPREVAFG